MLQCYNQVNTKYDSYVELFTDASGDVFNGTAIKQIADKGVPLQKLVVGKPVTFQDASNSGYVKQTDLGQWALKAYQELGWFAGIGHWQYPSDKTGGQAIIDAAGPLMAACAESGTCVEQ